MGEIAIHLPLTESLTRSLHAGDLVRLTGALYTGRDAAHRRMIEGLKKGEPLPFDPRGQLIYYVGPAPASPGHATGPAGPTTSYRMDTWTPKLLELGLLGMLGKGSRSQTVIDAMKRHGAIYFGAVGGAAALISKCIVSSEVIAYEDLGTEAVHRFCVVDLPAIVLIDSLGNNLYETEPPKYQLKSL